MLGNSAEPNGLSTIIGAHAIAPLRTLPAEPTPTYSRSRVKKESSGFRTGLIGVGAGGTSARRGAGRCHHWSGGISYLRNTKAIPSSMIVSVFPLREPVNVSPEGLSVNVMVDPDCVHEPLAVSV